MGVLLVIGGRGRGGRGRTISNPVSDNFNRASLGANWTVHLGSAAIVASTDWGATASGAHISSYTAITPGLNQYVEARTASGLSSLMDCQIYLRRRSSDLARYAFHYNRELARWEIKYDGVATEFTVILTQDAVTAAVQAGDHMRFECRGTNPVELKGYLNGALILSTTDAQADRIVAAGTPGLVCRAVTGQSPSYPQPIFADFATGTLLL